MSRAERLDEGPAGLPEQSQVNDHSDTRNGAFTGIRVGADLTSVAEVAEALSRFGDRYLHRIYTDHEIACCTGSSGDAAPRLAARFAAKEATIKVLEPSGAQPAWRSIEVRRDPSGVCRLRLTGEAARQAEAAGIEELAVSLTHEGPLGAAVVVAVGKSPAGPGARPRQS